MAPPEGSILLVDDEAGIRDSLGSYLKGLGYEVSLAQNAYEALEHLERFTYFLVITDITITGPSTSQRIAPRSRSSSRSSLVKTAITARV